MERLKRLLKKEGWPMLVIAIALFVLNYNLMNRLDVISDDDDLYYMLGMDYLKGNYRDPDFGPLYCVWQVGIQLITKNPITTFYINWVFLTILPCIALYSLARSFGASRVIGVIVTILYMYSDLHFPLTPKLTHFVIIFLGIGAAFTNSVSPLLKQLMVAGITLWLSSYIRPEMYIGVFILLAWMFYVSYRQKTYRQFVIVLGLVAVSALFLGSPMRQNDRSFWTFKHHFSINYVNWYPEINLSPWNHFNQITTTAFGHQLSSPTDAFLTKPDLVIRHVTTNIKGLFTTTFMFIKNIFFDQLNQTLAFPHRKYLVAILLLGLLAAIDPRKTWQTLLKRVSNHKIGWVILCLMMIPSVISTVIIFPRHHYVLYHFLFHLTAISVFLSSICWRELKFIPIPKINPAIGMAMSVIALCVFLYPRFQANAKSQPTPFREFALMLQSLHLEGKVTILGGDVPFTYPRFAGESWELLYFDIFRPNNFARFINEKSVNCVIINQKMRDFFKDDTSYKAFLKKPEALGFSLIKQTPNHQVFYKK